MWLRTTCLVAIAGISACHTPTDPDVTRVPGYLIMRPIGPDVSVESLATGVVVRVTTYGNGCFRSGDVDVEVDDDSVVIRPFDLYQATPQEVCADVLREFKYEVRAQLKAPRPWTVVVLGRESPTNEPVRIERTVE